MLILGDRKFIEAAFDSETELEGVVVANFESLFGPSSLYFPKALIRTRGGFGTIPDGFVIDLEARQWFMVEAELGKHSVWNHIVPQVTKQIIAARNAASRQLLIDLMVEKVRDDPAAMEKFTEEEIEVINIRRVLGEILEGDPRVGMPIDTISSDLREWATTLSVGVKLWIVRKYVEFGHPEQVLYEIPEEFLPALDTKEEESDPRRKRKYDVTLSDLIQAGVLRDGQQLLLPWQPQNGDRQVFKGVVIGGGEIEVRGKTFANPSYAAVYALQSGGSRSTTANGWKRWRTEDGVLLSGLREQYLQSPPVPPRTEQGPAGALPDVPTKPPHIERRPGVCGGTPVIRGTRITVRDIAVLHKDGASVDEMRETYPHLQASWVQDAISYYQDHREEIEREIEANRIDSVLAQTGGVLDEKGVVRFPPGKADDE